MKVVVIGGGAAGMMAAITSASNGAEVVLLEKNEKLGKKLYITGKGRCNLTNDSDFESFQNNIVSNAKFLTSALRYFDSKSCERYFESLGLPLKIERGNRVFPESDKSSDVIKVLQKELVRRNVDVRLNERVIEISEMHVVTQSGKYEYDNVIIATGGVSYPATGSTGDGYIFAKKIGHEIIKPVPALCGIKVNYCEGANKSIAYKNLPKLQGLSLKNVSVSVWENKENGKKLFSEFGEMLFTANGISGPVVLTLSSFINRIDVKSLKIVIDLKPALSDKQLDERLLRDIAEQKNKQLKNSLNSLLPNSLISPIIVLSGIPQEKPLNSITKAERKILINLLKRFTLIPDGLEDISSAIVTSGGINVKEINPKTMQSKINPKFFFCGEVLDVDALTGGFNLQIAFSTAVLAGKFATKGGIEE